MRDGREERGDATRDALLTAARVAFAERGYGAASVRDIARRAEAHPALVTYHFGTKAALWEQVVDAAMTGLRGRIVEALAQGTTLRERARHAVGAYLDHLEATPDFPKLIARAALDGDAHVLSMARDHLRPLAMLGEATWGPDARQFFLTFFGASVAPYLYASVLAEAFGDDVLSEAHTARRRQHLESLVDLVLPQEPS